ncbi:MAG: hypothetical protein ACO3AV_08375 [Ilumatobacteraceae bacterium]|jgi:hypothetical protein
MTSRRPEPEPTAHTITLDFAQAARALGGEARRRGLVVPGFRSPPRIVGVDRSIRHHRNGAVVAVRVKGRPFVAVLADMIEGVVAANHLKPPEADRLRSELWAAVVPTPGEAEAPGTRVA